jgi:hypothetical protein
MKSLKLTSLEGTFRIHRLETGAVLPKGVFSSRFYAITKTEDELSVVAPEGIKLEGGKSEGGWVALKVAGPLEFSETGLLAGLANTLAGAGVPIFAISTFDTDYILLKQENLKAARAALLAAGHKFGRARAKDEAKTAPLGYAAYQDLLEKQLPAIQKLLTEKLGPAALASLRSKTAIVVAVGSAYEFLPAAVRIVVPRQVFVDFCIENIDRLLPGAAKKTGKKEKGAGG